MDSDTVVLNMDNCEPIAKKIVDLLKDRVFKIITAYYDGDKKTPPKILDNLTIRDGYRFVDGCVIIYLVPRRRISWDLATEKVSVTFWENGDITIQRDLSNSRTIYRVIVRS